MVSDAPERIREALTVVSEMTHELSQSPLDGSVDTDDAFTAVTILLAAIQAEVAYQQGNDIKGPLTFLDDDLLN